MIGKVITFRTHMCSKKYIGRCTSYTCDDFGRALYLNIEVNGLIFTRTFKVYSDQIVSIT